MAGLLDGLSKLGLGNLEGADIFAEEQNKKEETKEQETKVMEEDFLFDKSFTCPSCDKVFKARTVKTGKAKLLGTDMDLRPRYEGIDMQKYDVISCPYCGYSALTRYFNFLTENQGKFVKEGISKSFSNKNPREEKEVYAYEEALDRYKLCLANAIVKKAKSSEKAYICLKAAWLLRGMIEELNETDELYEEKRKELTEQEDEFLKNALEGFISARQGESFPICGMDETTIDYLIAVLAFHFEKYDVASKLIAAVITSSTANPRMKDKAREVKELILLKLKKK